MISSPFLTLPLALNPYFSRINNNYDTSFGDPKNYYLIGFKPGFPLQASELNELQEQFFLQQTLTNTCISNWNGKGSPFWAGATPLNPNQIIVTVGATTTRTVIINPGWFFVNIPTSTSTNGFGVWIWNNKTFNQSIDFEAAATSGTQYGIYLNFSSVIDYTMDSNLSDNSGGGSSIKSSSADRVSINVIDYAPSDDQTAANNFFPIFKIVKRDAANIWDVVSMNLGIISTIP